MVKIISLFGLLVMIGFAFLISENKKKVDWRLVVIGVTMQIVFGLLILKWQPGINLFNTMNDFVVTTLGFAQEGTRFLFGNLLDIGSFGYIFALQVLPTIIFFSAVMAVLYHMGVMGVIISLLAKSMGRLMGTSGAESLSAAANIFVGGVEAPLVIKPFIKSVTRSELMTIMTGGMATVAGGVMAGYVSMGIDAGHLIAASIMSAPASLVIAKIMIPETEEPITKGNFEMEMENIDANVIDAAARGTSEGLTLALNVGAMLLSFIAIVGLLNALVGAVGQFFGMDYLSIEWILGRIFAPLSFIMGVPWQDTVQAGNLLGQKVVINEFYAYANLSTLIKEGTLQPRTITILTYALCGFSNFGTIGIQVGGLGAMAPNRRHELAKLGFRALIGGSLAAFMTATIAGILL